MTFCERNEVERALDRRGALALFAIVLALFLATASGLPDDPDAEVEFQTTRSLVRDGSWALGDSPEARAIVAQGFDVSVGRDGRSYSWFGVGQALSGVPFYLAGSALEACFPSVEARHAATKSYGVARSQYFEHLLVGLRNPLWGACLVVLVFSSSRRLGASRKSAWFASFALATTTYLWPQARSTLSDVQAALFLMLAFERWIALHERSSAATLAALGAGVGASTLTRIAVAPAAALIAIATFILLVRRRESARAWFALVAPLAICAVLFAATNFARFGSMFETGYGRVLSSGTFFSYPWYLGLAGVLVAPGKGLLWMASGLVLVPLGWNTLVARGRCWVVSLAFFVALFVLAPFVATQAWTGGYTYGPRYALPLVAPLWIAIAFALERLKSFAPWSQAILFNTTGVVLTHDASRSIARIAALGLFAFGFVVALGGVVVDHMTHEDLAAQAARVAWPDAEGADERERDDARFVSIQWDPRFAAPWAHWRILAARWAGASDHFSARSLFFLDQDVDLVLGESREKDFDHLAWFDLKHRLGGAAWPVWVVLGALVAAGIHLARSAFPAANGIGPAAGSS